VRKRVKSVNFGSNVSKKGQKGQFWGPGEVLKGPKGGPKMFPFSTLLWQFSFGV
jgi:hypothetical protein